MQTDTSHKAEEKELRKLIEGWVEAVRAKDLDGLTSGYAPDIRSFDVIAPLQSRGAQTLRQKAKEWLSSYDGPIECEVRDLTLAAGEDVAFTHSLNRYAGTKRGGEKSDMWVRVTLGWKKSDGRWTVAHEHVSVPIDPETLRAELALEP